MLVRKNGQVVDIPIRSRAIVRLRSCPEVRGLVLRNQKASDFSRVYGRQVYVWRNGSIAIENVGDLHPIGVAKRVPQVCRQALVEYLADYPEE